jgi:hypothetical protein
MNDQSTPDPKVRLDVGGWISGPCLSAPVPGENDRHTRYYIEVEALDKRLDDVLRGLRDQQDRGQITTREAADARIAALQTHIAECQALRERYLGGS